MNQLYNIYCDESCHLENDRQKAMVLGAVWCPTIKIEEISIRLREIKRKHSVKDSFEVKWSKVSVGKQAFYLDCIDYYFDNDDLHFRALIIPDKSILTHAKYSQDHDIWYYKMYFLLLNVLFSPEDKYRVYLDIKDSRGGTKVAKLHEVLCNNMYDFNRSIIEKVQIIRSHESEIMQLADLLIGAISYINRGLGENQGKMAIIDRIKNRSRYSLVKSTLLKENKFNIFKWIPSEVE